MTITSGRPVRSAVRRRLAVAALIAVVGIAGSGIWAGLVVLDRLDAPTSFTRVVPGDRVDLAAGSHVLYVEGTAPAALGGISVTGPDDDAVALRPIGDVRYDVPVDSAGRVGVVGTAVGEFRADVPGAYLLDAGTAPDGVRLAVGHDVARATLRAVVPAGLAAVAALVTALALAVRAAQGGPRRTEVGR